MAFPDSPEVRLRKLYDLVGRAVVVPIPYGEKGPRTNGWQSVSFEQSLEPAYQQRICDCFSPNGGNLGLIVGPSSDNLVDLDIDAALSVEPFLDANSLLQATLRRCGKRGCGIMFRIEGDYPIGRWDMKLTNGSKFGEWRGGGGHQSVIFGRHPETTDDGQPIDYKIVVVRQPIRIRFDQIIWPHWIARPLPWEKASAARPNGQYDADADLDKRIRAYIATMPAAVSGQRGHDATFKVACVLIQGWALSVDEAWLYLRAYNALCKPPWSDKELEHKLADAVKAPLNRSYGVLRNSVRNSEFSKKRAEPSDEASTSRRYVDADDEPSAGNDDESTAAAAPAAADTPADTPNVKSKKLQLVLPSGAISFEDVAAKLFPVLAERRRYFVKDRLLVEIAYKKPMKDDQLHDVFQLLEPDAFRSRLEKDFYCFVWREKGDNYILKPGRCTNDAAKVLLKTDEAFEHLPTISFLSAQPVYTRVGDELKILYRGYHDVHGGIYVSHGGEEIVIPELDVAVELILDALKDFDFVSDSDKSRAVASLISPALRVGKFLGDADFPIDISEGDQSQSGKTFRLKLICAIYGETPYVIANRTGGVGSLDESISTALVAGTPFILFENFRGQMNSQLVESCLRGTGMVPARIPYRGEVQVSTAHINWQLSSNGIEATRDFINRSVINRISKRPANYKFASYAEGDILAHIKANQAQYLGAVFSIIRHWHAEGCLRTEENRHDFIEWAQTLDWIVQLFGLPSLLDGHIEEVLRVSDPALSWLRQIGIAVEKDKRLDEGLSASEIVDICQAHSIEFPNKTSTNDLNQLAMLAGRLLGRVFSNLADNGALNIDRYEVTHDERIQTRPSDGAEFRKHYYWFKKR
jgi:hypothetical protein